MDNASEKETEALLRDFAEAFGDRALLIRNDRIEEFVALVNRGLSKADAPIIALVRNTAMVRKGWLEPMLELIDRRPEAGLLVPRLIPKGRPSPRGSDSSSGPVECSPVEFTALLVQKKLYEAVGGFDEGLDGAVWCLKDYCRRAGEAGYLTFRVPGSAVLFEEEISLCSVTRREERLRRSISTFQDRWGREQDYFLELPATTDKESLGVEFERLLGAARRGNRFMVVVHPKSYRDVLKNRYHLLHDNIVVEKLPLFFPSSSAKRVLAKMRREVAELKVIQSSAEFYFGPDGGSTESMSA